MNPSSRSEKTSLRHRFGIGLRIATALGGGYTLASLLAALLALTLPLQRDEAVLAGAFAAFLAYPVTVLWTFWAKTARVAWLGVFLPATAMGVAVWLLRGGL